MGLVMISWFLLLWLPGLADDLNSTINDWPNSLRKG